MLDFSPSKVNIGLNIIERREDGFHNIETVFYPLQWMDAIEILKTTDNQAFKLTFSGSVIKGDPEDNILQKAYRIMKNEYPLPNLKVHLHKTIPMGAGLGGGSSNAATFINLLDITFELQIPLVKKIEMARLLGSDCAFFIENKAVFAIEKGDVFQPIKLKLNQYYILVVYPNIHCDTQMAYKNVRPKKPEIAIKTIIETKAIEEWRNFLMNDFENSIFEQYPEIKLLKENLYHKGAVYASMSGSGSAVFGIFKEKPKTDFKKGYLFFLQEPKED